MVGNTQKPVFLLTGFLGSGKTTLLNQLLQKEEFADTLVIVNEFGVIGLDHLLIETSSDTILELSNGCLCCSVRGELVETLLDLDDSRFSRIIIETTGIADPIPVFQSLAAQPELATRFKPAAVISVIDGIRGIDILEQYEEARNQLAIADMFFLSKLDLVKTDSAKLHQKIKSINPHASLFEDADKLTPDNIESAVVPKTLDHSAAHHPHSTNFTSIVLVTEQVLDIKRVSGLLHHIANTLGNDLLRIKGLVQVSDHVEMPLVVQVSGPIVHNFRTLKKWPATVQHTQLVVITKNVPPSLVQSIFDGFVGNPITDTPDYQAVMENPLAVPGKVF